MNKEKLFHEKSCMNKEKNDLRKLNDMSLLAIFNRICIYITIFIHHISRFSKYIRLKSNINESLSILLSHISETDNSSSSYNLFIC